MISLSVELREKVKSRVNDLRREKLIPAVLYGPEIKENLNLKVSLKEFESVFKKAGESSLVSLKIKGKKEEIPVLIHDVQYGPLSGRPTHVDFYQPLMKEETEVTVPITLEGVAPAVKNIGGTLVQNISEIEVKALPQKLPQDIKVSVKKLETFDDVILVGDLEVPEGVKILREPEEVLISVSPPEKVEEIEKAPLEEKAPVTGKEEAEEKESPPAGEEKESPPAGKEKEGQ
jgi:large subunit ribosomal protein L25